MHSRAIATVILSFALAAPSRGQTLQATVLKDTLGTPLVFSAPMAVVSPPGDTTRLFVVERAGRIRIVKNGTTLLATDFLNLTGVVSATPGTEEGLFGLAFHPDYASNGRFFVSYSENTSGLKLPVVEEYAVSANPDVANPASAVTVFGPYPHGAFHYASDLHFGLDRKLYYTLGYSTGTSQDLSTYDGKLLRLDVDVPFPHVPLTGNPFPSSMGAGAELTWALGLRNPFRFSFDRVTGDIYIGDVGTMQFEEIEFLPAGASGLDYGFPCMEGSTCFPTPLCVGGCPPSPGTFTPPVYDYPHVGFTAVIGGFAYRGSAIPGFQGRYFFADFGTNAVGSFVVSGGTMTGLLDHTADIQGPGMPTTPIAPRITSFGEDADGELYVTSLTGNAVFRIEPVTPPCTAPFSYCVTSPNSVGSGAVIGSAGSASITANELVLTVRHCPPLSTGLFFLGTTQVSVPFGNGIRCVGGTIVRTSIVNCDVLGNVNVPYDFVAYPVTAGTTSTIQFYYRDSLAGGAAFNLSDGRSVTFCP